VGLHALSLAIALGSPPRADCMKTATTQTALNACASEESAKVESQRKALYHRVLARAHGQQAVAKLKKAESDWIAYRTAYLEAMYPLTDKQRNYGTIYPMEVNLLFTDLTRTHIRELQRLLGGPGRMLCAPSC
jgi:uncharacterized protein YecT (DUF1311 family)